MNQNQFIRLELLSDTSFSRGEGVAGIVDIEVEHDEFGLPFLGGKTLRGLLRDSWLSMKDCLSALSSAERIFGIDADFEEHSMLRIGDAVVDSETRRWVVAAKTRSHSFVTPVMVLASLTDIRSQTSENRTTGAPEEATLRSVRVINRGLVLQAPLYWQDEPTQPDLYCLSLVLWATRHAGLARNRGRGHIRLSLVSDLENKAAGLQGGVA